MEETLIDDSPADTLPTSNLEKPRGRGRPPGTKNKPKASSAVDQLQLIILASAGLRLTCVLLAWRLQYPPLLMSDKEASDIAKPLSRIVGRSALMKIYGKYLVGSSDYVALGIAIYSYGERVWSQTQIIAAANMQAKKEASGMDGHESNGYAASTAGDGPVGAGFGAAFRDLTPNRGD